MRPGLGRGLDSLLKVYDNVKMLERNIKIITIVNMIFFFIIQNNNLNLYLYKIYILTV